MNPPSWAGFRHARPCAGHPRLPCCESEEQGVDGRDRPVHDGLSFCMPRKSKLLLNPHAGEILMEEFLKPIGRAHGRYG
jgi:hypothetical protein